MVLPRLINKHCSGDLSSLLAAADLTHPAVNHRRLQPGVLAHPANLEQQVLEQIGPQNLEPVHAVFLVNLCFPANQR